MRVVEEQVDAAFNHVSYLFHDTTKRKYIAKTYANKVKAVLNGLSLYEDFG